MRYMNDPKAEHTQAPPGPTAGVVGIDGKDPWPMTYCGLLVTRHHAMTSAPTAPTPGADECERCHMTALGRK